MDCTQCVAEAGIGRWEAILIAAAVSSAVALLGIWQTARTARQDRQRRLFGEALAAVMEYREYPFIVRRRTSDAERGEISRELSKIQAALNRYSGMLAAESKSVGAAYALLVEQIRTVAGPLIADGWNQSVRTHAAAVYIDDVDMSALDPATGSFIQATSKHLGILPAFRPRRR